MRMECFQLMDGFQILRQVSGFQLPTCTLHFFPAWFQGRTLIRTIGELILEEDAEEDVDIMETMGDTTADHRDMTTIIIMNMIVDVLTQDPLEGVHIQGVGAAQDHADEDLTQEVEAVQVDLAHQVINLVAQNLVQSHILNVIEVHQGLNWSQR